MMTLSAMYQTKKGSDVIIFRDNNGKWFVTVDGVQTQKKMNASEIVRYLANALEGK